MKNAVKVAIVQKGPVYLDLEKSLDKMIGAVRYWEDKAVPEPLLKAYNDYLAGINFDHFTNSIT